MTTVRSIPVTCPHCEHQQPFQMYESVNTKLDKSLKERLLSRELCTFTCEQCEEKSPVHYPLLYHDMDISYMIWLRDSEVGDELENSPFQQLFNRPDSKYRFRWVKNLNELIEKIHIFDGGFDDRFVEVNKFMIMFQLKEQQVDISTSALYYSGFASDDGSLLFALVLEDESSPSLIQFPAAGYHDIAERFSPFLEEHEGSSKFLRVDWQYAHDLITRYPMVFE